MGEPASAEEIGQILDVVSEVCYALDGSWRFIFFNGGAEAYFGIGRDQVLGRELWSFFPREQAGLFGEMLDRAMTARQSGKFTEPSSMHPERTVVVRVGPIGTAGVAVAIEDVTDAMAANAAAEHHQQRLNLAVGAHHIGIYDWHIPSGALVWTGEMKSILGVEDAALTGQIEDHRGLVHPDDIERLRGEHAATLAAGETTSRYQYRIRRPDGEIRWVEGAGRFIPGADGRPERMVGTLIDVTERKAAERHERLLLNELNHRVKNTLATVQGLARQSFRSTEIERAAREAFDGRLTALSAAHNVLTQLNWEAAPIGQIIEVAVAVHRDRVGRVSVSGPRLDLEPQAAVALSLAIHELGTNALKYGALSRPEGRVDINWTAEAGRLRIVWRERGGPTVIPPTRRGFGSRLLERGLAEELGGTVRLTFAPEGLICEVEAPLDA
ncbi:MAG: HWE histidine kinase domain-containing protein [Pseudomonadota bacterium]